MERWWKERDRWIEEGGKKLLDPPLIEFHQDAIEYCAALSQVDRWRPEKMGYITRRFTKECGEVLYRLLGKQGIKYL
jgi:hypothetical protein